jgi:8-amino-7-oxononanoate synthase
MSTDHPHDGSFQNVIARRRERGCKRALDGMGYDDVARTGIMDVFREPVDTMAEEMAARGIPYVSFGHYDYLGLAHHPQVIEAGVDALRHFGSGAGASRLVGGERSINVAFEQSMAKFLGVGGTLAMISGYLTNLTLIPHLLTAKDLLILDDLAHNSIASAARVGGYACRTFAHNDCDALESILVSERSKYRNVLVVTEGMFSMDGDIPDLPRLLTLKDTHSAWLMLDEAHSYGVLGAHGRGITEHFGVDPARVDISVGTLSKSFAASGGFIAAAPPVIDWLRFTLPGFVFSVGLSPVTVATAHAALGVLEAEPERLHRLRENSVYFLTKARAAGLNTGPAIGMAVVPLLFDSTAQTMRVSQCLRQAGIYAPPVARVGVPTDKPRVRFFISENHTPAQIDAAIAVIAAATA